ncbi:hypothetical protein PLICRDRAFT_110166 [Plicaturopsis crispa FD-325 SS-3]|nr:hypothetical protein PLICRDRAFT_110166 [Plicaturopsis crispa FD-325 SS-3]
MNEGHARYPAYTRLSPGVAREYAEATRRGDYELNTSERKWRDLYTTFKQRGYILRRRYDPNWTPSWIGTNLDPTWCEDSIRPIVYNVIDATRIAGGQVAIKLVENNTPEVRIAQYLTSPDLLWNPINHCVPIIDVIPDPKSRNLSYLVMPLLRPFDDPDFCFVGEVIDFIGQTLQGLTFIHDQNIAHRDCAAMNIMMDAAPLYPRGFHPVRRDYSRDAIHELTPLSRLNNPVRYYFTDFGLSTQFAPDQPPFVVGVKGRDKEVPELSRDIPYNAYKVDIFILGNLYRKSFIQKYQDLDFLIPLVQEMTQRDPNRRPSASDAFDIFRDIHEQLDPSAQRWRLRPRNETVPERVVRDTIAVAKGGMSSIRRLVGQQ